MIGRRAARPVVLCGMAACSLAAHLTAAGAVKGPSAIWSAPVAGVRWKWTPRDLTASGTAVPGGSFSLKRALFPEGIPDGFTEFQSTVRPLSLFATVLCYRRDDYWSGGAHPSGGITYAALDLRRPKRPLLLTEVFPEAEVARALWNDPVVHQLAVRAGLRTQPATAAELVRRVRGRSFGGEDDLEYALSEEFLAEWAVHHLEGERAAVRLCASWSSEIYRFHSTEIGLLLPIPAAYRPALVAAASGREGFLAREAARRFRGRSATLVEGRSRNP